MDSTIRVLIIVSIVIAIVKSVSIPAKSKITVSGVSKKSLINNNKEIIQEPAASKLYREKTILKEIIKKIKKLKFPPIKNLTRVTNQTSNTREATAKNKRSPHIDETDSSKGNFFEKGDNPKFATKYKQRKTKYELIKNETHHKKGNEDFKHQLCRLCPIIVGLNMVY